MACCFGDRMELGKPGRIGFRPQHERYYSSVRRAHGHQCQLKRVRGLSGQDGSGCEGFIWSEAHPIVQYDPRR